MSKNISQSARDSISWEVFSRWSACSESPSPIAGCHAISIRRAIPVKSDPASVLPGVAVIIPTLNEANQLGASLATLGDADEIIVVDGKSEDSTKDVAGEFDVTFLSCPDRNRARQMNLGAEKATDQFLLFLHADTRLERESLAAMRIAMDYDPSLVGGCFRRFFDSESRFLRLTSRLANLRSRYFGVFLGDQGIFVRANLFREMGGFNEALPYGEDLDFSLRMRKRGKTIALDPPVITSARRFEKRGPVIQTLVDIWLSAKLSRIRQNSQLHSQNMRCIDINL